MQFQHPLIESIHHHLPTFTYLIDIERYRDIDAFILLTRTWTICLMPYLAQDVPTSTNRHPYIIISPLSRHIRLFHKLWSQHHSSQCLVAGPSATPVMRMVSQVSRHHIWISKSGTGSYQYQLSSMAAYAASIFVGAGTLLQPKAGKTWTHPCVAKLPRSVNRYHKAKDIKRCCTRLDLQWFAQAPAVGKSTGWHALCHSG